MKKMFQLLAVSLALGAMALQPAKAESFNVTNTLASGILVQSWPTNSTWTNGLGFQTGQSVSVANQEWAGFYFSGFSTTNTNSTVTVQLVRAPSAYSPPMVTATTSDFETGTPVISIAIPIAGSGPQTYFTNLDRFLIGGVQYVGVYNITNSNAGANGNLTNVVMGINKKIIPIRYP